MANFEEDLRVAIIGNSNSVMRNSYVSFLKSTKLFNIDNFSIGSSPNVVILDFIARYEIEKYQYVIIETCVVDYIQSGSIYSKERSQETLDILISQLTKKNLAKIIIFCIPTMYHLIDPDNSWQESVYTNFARKNGLLILNGFNVLRSFIGPSEVTDFRNNLKAIYQSLVNCGFPSGSLMSLAWNSVNKLYSTDRCCASLFFSDPAHLSEFSHNVFGQLLSEFMNRSKRRATPDCDVYSKRPVEVLMASNGLHVVRESSLIKRNVVALEENESIIFDCPLGWYVYGITINKAATFGFLEIQCEKAAILYDMRFQPEGLSWNAAVIPILENIGDGQVIIKILSARDSCDSVVTLHNTVINDYRIQAEIGELIIVESSKAKGEISTEANQILYIIEKEIWARNIIAKSLSSARSTLSSLHCCNKSELDQTADFLNRSAYNMSANVGPAHAIITLCNILMGKKLESLSYIIGRPKSPQLNDFASDLNIAILNGNTPEAQIMLYRVLEENPDIRILTELAWIAFHGEDWNETVQRWHRIIDSFPGDAIGYMGVSLSLERAGSLDWAIETVSDAIQYFCRADDLSERLSLLNNTKYNSGILSIE